MLHHPLSICQCSVNTTPLQVEALFPEFQEWPTADDESGLIIEPTKQNVRCNTYNVLGIMLKIYVFNS